MKNIFILRKLDDMSNPELELHVNHIIANCSHYNKKVLTDESQCEEDTLIISLGGDGTMLYACGLSAKYGSLVVGINLGNLGFLTPFTSDFLYTEEFKYLINSEGYRSAYISNFRIMKRNLLSTKLYDEDANLVTVDALNEFVLTCKNSRGILQYTIDIVDRNGNSSFMGNHTSSGIVISTPTGSTAYSLNIGGCIISPDANVLQIQHISPASMSTRPIVLGNSNSIEIELTAMKNSEGLSLRKDGQEISLGVNQRYTFRLCENVCSTIIPKNLNHFSILSEKLGWNKHYI